MLESGFLAELSMTMSFIGWEVQQQDTIDSSLLGGSDEFLITVCKNSIESSEKDDGSLVSGA